MEHKIVLGGSEYLPFARSCVQKLKAAGLAYVNQSYMIGDVSVNVRIEPGHEYIRIDGGSSLYEFFTTGPKPINEASITEALRGYAVRVSIDKKTKKLKGSPRGSTAEASSSTPPGWKYKASSFEMTRFLPHHTFQANAYSQHQYFPGASAPKFLMSPWTNPKQTTYLLNDGLFSRVGQADIAYDLAPSVFSSEGWPAGGRSGVAPESDWYRRAAIRTVTHPDHGSRTLILMTDVAGNLYVYPTDGADDALRAGSPYAGQAIKTNIPNDNVVKEVIPHPAWAIKHITAPARDSFPKNPPLGATRWEFNSTATKMVCVFPGEMPKVKNGVVPEEPDFSNKDLEQRELVFGMVEIDIGIELTGPKANEFRVLLTTTVNSSPFEGDSVCAAGYYWGDLKAGIHAPTGAKKDDLIVMTMHMYHRRAAKGDPYEPPYLEERCVSRVKVWGSPTVLREFTTSHSDPPYWYTEVPYSGSTLDQTRSEAGRLVSELVRHLNFFTQYQEIYQLSLKFGVWTRAFVASAGSANITKTAAFDKEVQGYIDKLVAFAQANPDITALRGSRKDDFYRYVRTGRSRIQEYAYSGDDRHHLMNSLLTYDLRALAFVTQTAAFITTGKDIRREDRVQVIVRNEVVHTDDAPSPEFVAKIETYDHSWDASGWDALDHTWLVNPGKSVFGWSLIRHGMTNVHETHISRQGFNANYPAAAAAYHRKIDSFFSGAQCDVIQVHPAGHWAVNVVGMTYYAGVSKVLRFGDMKLSEVDAAKPDAAKFSWKHLDIVCVQVTGKDGAASTIRSSHVDLFNEAYDKNIKPGDYSGKPKYSSVTTSDGTLREVSFAWGGVTEPIRFLGVAHSRPGAGVGGTEQHVSVRHSTVASYFDIHNRHTGGALSSSEFDTDGALLLSPYTSYLPMLAGSCLFSGPMEVKL